MFLDCLDERNALVKSIPYFDNFTKWIFFSVNTMSLIQECLVIAFLLSCFSSCYAWTGWGRELLAPCHLTSWMSRRRHSCRCTLLLLWQHRKVRCPPSQLAVSFQPIVAPGLSKQTTAIADEGLCWTFPSLICPGPRKSPVLLHMAIPPCFSPLRFHCHHTRENGIWLCPSPPRVVWGLWGM
jgi:hypothetical protein